MIVRALDSDELEIFRAIRIESLRAEPSAYASRVEDWERLSEDDWRRRLKGLAVVVALDGDEPAGIMALMREPSSKAAHRAMVIMVFVRESLRGTGVASTLMETLVSHALGLGVRQLELRVNAENGRAIHFYQRLGFLEVGRIPGALIHEGLMIDEIMMARRIDT